MSEKRRSTANRSRFGHRPGLGLPRWVRAGARARFRDRGDPARNAGVVKEPVLVRRNKGQLVDERSAKRVGAERCHDDPAAAAHGIKFGVFLEIHRGPSLSVFIPKGPIGHVLDHDS